MWLNSQTFVPCRLGTSLLKRTPKRAKVRAGIKLRRGRGGGGGGGKKLCQIRTVINITELLYLARFLLIPRLFWKHTCGKSCRVGGGKMDMK